MARVGTGHTEFRPTSGTDTWMRQGQLSTINTRLQCITGMKEYENKSLEELRCEDFRDRRQLLLLLSSNVDDPHNMWLSSWTLMENIMALVKIEFNVSLDADTRLWSKASLSHGPDSIRPVNLLDKTLEELRILNGHVLIIEVKNDDGTWPKDVGYHKRNLELPQRCDNQQFQTTDRFKILHGEMEKIQVQATSTRKRLDMINKELSDIDETHKMEKKKLNDQETELETIKKQQEILSDRRYQIEAGLEGVKITETNLSHKLKIKELERDKLCDELKALEKSLQEYTKTTKDFLDKIEPEKNEKGSITVYMAESIKEKEAALECPVCFETASAPIFMCQQMHLICSRCRPKLKTCPVCRERYRENKRHRYAEMMAEELKKLKDLSTEKS